MSLADVPVHAAPTDSPGERLRQRRRVEQGGHLRARHPGDLAEVERQPLERAGEASGRATCSQRSSRQIASPSAITRSTGSCARDAT